MRSGDGSTDATKCGLFRGNGEGHSGPITCSPLHLHRPANVVVEPILTATARLDSRHSPND